MDNPNPSAEKSSKELRDEKSRDLKLEEQVKEFLYSIYRLGIKGRQV